MAMLWSSPLTGFSTKGFRKILPSISRASPSSISSTAWVLDMPPPMPSSEPDSDIPLIFFTCLASSTDSKRGPPSRVTSKRMGVGTRNWSNIIKHSRRSHSIFCIWRSLTRKGFRSWTYLIAFSRGKPSEKKEIKKSQIGQFSKSEDVSGRIVRLR